MLNINAIINAAINTTEDEKYIPEYIPTAEETDAYLEYKYADYYPHYDQREMTRAINYKAWLERRYNFVMAEEIPVNQHNDTL